MRRLCRKEKGFTLIELMIVVAIIGILAAIAIPRFSNLIRKSKEGATKGNLGAIRSALSIYYGDNEGFFPYSAANSLQIIAGASTTCYLDAVPVAQLGVSWTGENLNTLAVDGTPASGILVTDPVGAIGTTAWVYNSVTGEIRVNNTGTDTKGNSYRTW